MTRNEYLQKCGMSLDDYLRDFIPSATMLVGIAYPDLHTEYENSDSDQLFANWITDQYPSLVSFVRSLSIVEKIGLVLATLDQQM